MFLLLPERSLVLAFEMVVIYSPREEDQLAGKDFQIFIVIFLTFRQEDCGWWSRTNINFNFYFSMKVVLCLLKVAPGKAGRGQSSKPTKNYFQRF